MHDKQLDIDTADIIATIETELAAEWYDHAAAERRAQREDAGSVDYSPFTEADNWGDFAVALGVWAVFPVALVLCMWLAGVGG